MSWLGISFAGHGMTPQSGYLPTRMQTQIPGVSPFELDRRGRFAGSQQQRRVIVIEFFHACSLPVQDLCDAMERPPLANDHDLETSLRHSLLVHASKITSRTRTRLSRSHNGVPYLRKLSLAAILIVALLILVNLLVWAICGIILKFHSHTHLLGTASLAYSLGLRHALDADHISAIDLMTRRLVATGQRPVTVGTFFSLGHSTVVVVTSIVVAATAAGVSKRFSGFSNVGGIIGTSVSAAFLILLGIMNAYILYRLIVQIQKVIRLTPNQESEEAWKFQGGGFKRMFRLIDRPWKMYPLGVLFGLGFDTSSEVALLGTAASKVLKEPISGSYLSSPSSSQRECV
ncbi:MAG: hypothetical protein Q9198_000612 [Flavoplaca austrocitrina]